MREFCLVPRAIVDRYTSPSTMAPQPSQPAEGTPQDRAPAPAPLAPAAPAPAGNRTSEAETAVLRPPLPSRAGGVARRIGGARGVFYLARRKGRVSASSSLPLPPHQRAARPRATATTNSPDPRPSLETQLPTYFSDSLLPYASALLNYYRHQSLLQWDRAGHIVSPFTGLNIIDVITVYSRGKGAVPSAQKPLYKMLQSFAPIPLSYIKNTSVKTLLSSTRGRAGAMIKEKRRQWKPYG